MSLTRVFVCCLLVTLAAGCKAQNLAAPVSSNPQLNRRIEVVVRSQFDVPPDVDVTIGALSKSGFPGYQNLPITFAGKGQPTTVNFLLSNDGNTVARLETFDISHNPAAMISTEGRPIRGLPAAKVTIVNFDDLECPYCAQMHSMLFPQTAEHYKGLVRFIYKDFPLAEIHPWAMHAAVDADCLANQNGTAYWDFVDYVHAHAGEITGASRDAKLSFVTLDKLAHEQGVRSKLNLAKLDACTQKQDESIVQASVKQGEALGVSGTPTIFINGERISGILPTPLLWLAIDRALKAAGVQPPPVTTAATGKPLIKQPAAAQTR